MKNLVRRYLDHVNRPYTLRTLVIGYVADVVLFGAVAIAGGFIGYTVAVSS